MITRRQIDVECLEMPPLRWCGVGKPEVGECVAHQQVTVFIINARLGYSDPRQEQRSTDQGECNDQQYRSSVVGQDRAQPTWAGNRSMEETEKQECEYGCCHQKAGFNGEHTQAVNRHV